MRAELEKLREMVTKEIADCKAKDGYAVVISADGGPASLPIVLALVDVVEAQAKKIDELESRLAFGK